MVTVHSLVSRESNPGQPQLQILCLLASSRENVNMRDNWLSQWAVCQSLTHAADTKGLLRKECGAGHRWFIRHSLLSWLPDSEETNVTQILIIASRINTVREWGGQGGAVKGRF